MTPIEGGVLSRRWRDDRRHRLNDVRFSRITPTDRMPKPDNFSPVVYYRSEGEPVEIQEFTLPIYPSLSSADSKSALQPLVKTLFSSDTAIKKVVPEAEVTIIDTKELALAS